VIENADTLYISVRTQYVAAGTPISIVMRDSRGTMIDSAATTSGTPDADAMSRVLVTLPAAATAAPGQYQIEAILDGVSQAMRPMAIGTNEPSESQSTERWLPSQNGLLRERPQRHSAQL